MELNAGKIRIKEDVLPLLAAILICLAAGFFGSIVTMPAITTWYAGLIKPSFSPPNWLFAPVWTLLYMLMGIAAFLVYKKGFNKPEVRNALYLFALQLLLNVLWSFLFFGMHSPLYGLIGVVFLWLSIAATLILFYRISKPAGLLFIPYLAWVSVASMLNLFIWMLNH